MLGFGFLLLKKIKSVPAQMVLGDVAGANSFSSESADTVFAGIPFRSMPFYSGEPWFLPLAMRFYRVKDKVAGLKK